MKYEDHGYTVARAQSGLSAAKRQMEYWRAQLRFATVRPQRRIYAIQDEQEAYDQAYQYGIEGQELAYVLTTDVVAAWPNATGAGYWEGFGARHVTS